METSSSSPPVNMACTDNPALEVVATSPTGVRDIQLTASDLYFLETPGDANAVRKVPLAGGMPETVLTENYVFTFLVEGGYVFVARNGGLFRTPLAGGTADYLGASDFFPADMLVRGGDLYWLTRGSPVVANSGRIQRIPMATATEPVPMATTLETPFANLIGLALGGDGKLYAAEGLNNAGTGGIFQEQGNGFTSVAAANNIHAITADATHVYWAVDTGLFRLALAGGTPEMLGYAQCGVIALQSDGVNLYWLSDGACDCSDRGVVGRMPVAGGAPTVLASVVGRTSDLRLDATHAYFIAGNNVVRIAR